MQQGGRTISEIASANGIELRRPSASGPTERVSEENLAKMLHALGVSTSEAITEDVAKCYIPEALPGQPCWGINLQLYELRSDRNWGIGDFADLRAICEFAAKLGADFVGLNPLHAGFLADADRCSPYEPSNRCFLNPLYIAVDEIGGFQPSAERKGAVDKLRGTPLVDYTGVAKIKLEVLREIWKGQRDQANLAFESFIADGGAPLHAHAVFETISHMMTGLGRGAGWKAWPAEYQTKGTQQVRAVEEARADEILFNKWLQWCAHIQLAEAKKRAREAGMRIGLYLDLAIGEALDGSATWSEPGAYARGVAIGNPPEPFAAEGQDWRLAALLPAAIANGENSPFERMLMASMRSAGAIRIDHAAAFARLFLVPTDGVPADGAYVTYPMKTMLRTLAATSKIYRCLVVGEDLGNIAEGLRENLRDADVLSYRILSYEQKDEAFVPPNEYPALALACVSTHDHQTFKGWWLEADIDLRLQHGLVSAETTEQHRKVRTEERKRLLDAFSHSGIIRGPDAPVADDDLAVAAYAFIAATPSMLVSVRLADMTGEKAATNVPGTNETYPNWKPKLSYRIEELASLPLVAAIAEVMGKARPR